MNNKATKIAIISLLSASIVLGFSSVALAAWWNPLTWSQSGSTASPSAAPATKPTVPTVPIVPTAKDCGTINLASGQKISAATVTQNPAFVCMTQSILTCANSNMSIAYNNSNVVTINLVGSSYANCQIKLSTSKYYAQCPVAKLMTTSKTGTGKQAKTGATVTSILSATSVNQLVTALTTAAASLKSTIQQFGCTTNYVPPQKK